MIKANPKLVGAFVLGAIALLMLAVIVFGKGRFFQPRLPVVMYFSGSVAGLQVGSPITYLGVRIGQVTDIQLNYDAESQIVSIPVFGEIFGDVANVSGKDRSRWIDFSAGKRFEEFIARGLKAQLSVPNFVTNQVNVTLDFLPSAASLEVRQVNGFLEIPTVASTFQEAQATAQTIFEKLQALPLDELIADGRAALSGASRLLNNPDLPEIFATARTTVNELQSTVRAVDTKIRPIVTNVDKVSGTAETTLVATQQRLLQLQAVIAQLDKTLTKFQGAVGNADNLLTNADTLVKTANAVLSPGSPVNYELVSALKEVAAAARAMRTLANTIERAPNAVVFGRPSAASPGGKE
jgi:paraquat-inducible protein B